MSDKRIVEIEYLYDNDTYQTTDLDNKCKSNWSDLKKLMSYIIIENFNSCIFQDNNLPVDAADALEKHFAKYASVPINMVNHPDHYGGADNPYEVIKVMEAWLTPEEFIGAMKFNIHKYNARAKKKGSELENYEKAGFYQLALIDFCKRHGIGIKV